MALFRPPAGYIDLNEAVARLYRRKYRGVQRRDNGERLNRNRLWFSAFRRGLLAELTPEDPKVTARYFLENLLGPGNLYMPKGEPEDEDEVLRRAEIEALQERMSLDDIRSFLEGTELAPEDELVDCEVEIRDAVLSGGLFLNYCFVNEDQAPVGPVVSIPTDAAAHLPRTWRPQRSSGATSGEGDGAGTVAAHGVNRRPERVFPRLIDYPGRWEVLRTHLQLPRSASMPLIPLLCETDFEAWLEKQRAAGHWPSVEQGKKKNPPKPRPAQPPKGKPGAPTKLTPELIAAVENVIALGRWVPGRDGAARLVLVLGRHHPDLALPNRRSIQRWVRSGSLGGQGRP